MTLRISCLSWPLVVFAMYSLVDMGKGKKTLKLLAYLTQAPKLCQVTSRNSQHMKDRNNQIIIKKIHSGAIQVNAWVPLLGWASFLRSYAFLDCQHPR